MSAQASEYSEDQVDPEIAQELEARRQALGLGPSKSRKGEDYEGGEA